MDLNWVVLSLLLPMLVAVVPAVGFAVLFNVPIRFLKYCGIAGAMGYGTRIIAMQLLDFPIEIASLAAASVVGCLAMYWSRKFLAPVQVFAVAAVIPMIPGKFAFGAMVGLMEMNLHNHFDPALMTDVLRLGLKTVFILMCLALGIAAPRLLFYRAKPVV
ncbi:threonine/serine exporter family protein [Echinimonas agarilytica]|uniref:Threonine/serine exporter family protein n=1 Tax=Echinimonas agarilytica TaxID=1215918 RepID=A0AA41W9X4_9GAMM|nr:threonine/serine exporter family protein [Echinimonas agarilytica]MCM2681301.1 threonine/serine exporter family protein [Echinimonas agarilytica]